MAALVSLACCLPAHAKLRADLWPADPEANRAVDERVKLSLCCVTRDRARLSRSRISVEDRREGCCAEPAVSTALCCGWRRDGSRANGG